jgi:hypothetical protein
MANETWNVHTHDAGLFRFDWDYYTDATLDQAYQTFKASASDGVSSAEVLNLIRAGTDFDQLTAREARQIHGALNAHWGQLSPEAKKVATKAMEVTDAAYPGSWVDDRLGFRGYWSPAPLIYNRDEDYAAKGDRTSATMQGDQLNAFVTDLETTALLEEIRNIAGALRG